MHKAHLGLLVLLLLPLQTFSQNADSLRLSRIDSELAALVGRDSTFRREVDVTSGRLSLSELLRNIARASGVNVSVRSVENIPVSCNFRRARVDDLVRFLCREYRLDVAASGNILSIFPAAAPTVPAPDPDVAYAAADTTLSYDLRGERLIDVAKKIARLSARNVIVPEPLYDCKVSGYVRRMPFDDALRTLAAVNGLLAERDAQDVWTLWREEPRPRRAARRPQAPPICAGGSSRPTNCVWTRWGASRPASRGATCRT